MANDGPLCRCATDQRRGINHGVYPGEKDSPILDASSNNLGNYKKFSKFIKYRGGNIAESF